MWVGKFTYEQGTGAFLYVIAEPFGQRVISVRREIVSSCACALPIMTRPTVNIAKLCAEA